MSAPRSEWAVFLDFAAYLRVRGWHGPIIWRRRKVMVVGVPAPRWAWQQADNDGESQ
jgi:hypothetical protein